MPQTEATAPMRLRTLVLERPRIMTTDELGTTGRWRWRLSEPAKHLARAEAKQRERARMYANFAEYRRQS